MNEIQTTIPISPTGLSTTEVPMGITGTLTTQLVSQDSVAEMHALFDPDRWIYIDKFVISQSVAPLKKVWSWWAGNPLKGNYTVEAKVGDPSTRTQLIPRSLVIPQFSRTAMISWELMFKPVKINDCRVQLDIINFYGREPADNVDLSSPMFLNDMIHYMVDDPNQVMVFKPNMFWLQRNVHSKQSLYDDNAFLDLPATLPNTYISVYMRTKYVPNLMQLDEFTMLVYARPIITGLSGFTSTVRMSSIGLFTLPYWYKNKLSNNDVVYSWVEVLLQIAMQFEGLSSISDTVQRKAVRDSIKSTLGSNVISLLAAHNIHFKNEK